MQPLLRFVVSTHGVEVCLPCLSGRWVKVKCLEQVNYIAIWSKYTVPALSTKNGRTTAPWWCNFFLEQLAKAVMAAVGNYKELSSGSSETSFWFHAVSQMSNYCVLDICTAFVDGLTRFPPVIQTVFLQAQIRLRIVDLIGSWQQHAPWKQPNTIAMNMKNYQSSTATQHEKEPW